MKTTDLDILFMPGWSGSGPDHWQSRWEERLSTGQRIEQDDWHTPRRDDWTARIVESVAQARRPVLLVAHSLGVHAIAHATAHLPPQRVAGAFLVAPPSEKAIRAIPGIDAAFAPFALTRLPFPTLVVASRSDPYARFEEVAAFADAWGAELVDGGDAGHINVASGHGPWPEGLMRLAAFLKTLGTA